MRINLKRFCQSFNIFCIFVLTSGVMVTCLRAETILIVKTQKFADQYEKALSGCLQELKTRGYKENDNLKLIYMDTSQSAVSIAKPFDIVYAVGAESALYAKEAFKNKPIVFSMVLDPAGRKLVQNLDNPEGNVTGVSLDISVQEYIRVLKSVIPKQITIGIIYDPASSKKFVETLQAMAPEVNIKIVSAVVHSPYEVLKSLDQILPKIDLYWLLLDHTVATRENISLILERCFQKKIGVYGFSPLMVKAGALLAPITEYEDVGRQAGDLIIEILTKKEQKNLPSVVTPKITNIAFNSTAANTLGLKITPEAQQMVKESY